MTGTHRQVRLHDWDIADLYTAAWLEDEALLNIIPADVTPRASDHIAEMIEMTGTLLDKGIAYEVDAGQERESCRRWSKMKTWWTMDCDVARPQQIGAAELDLGSALRYFRTIR